MSDSIKKLAAETFREIGESLEQGALGSALRLGITVLGSEHGPEEIVRGAEIAQRAYPGLEVVLIGPRVKSNLAQLRAADEEEQHKIMEEALEKGDLAACVTMNYNFPIGVSTVGRIIAPATGRKMLVATTTGASDSQREAAMVKNSIYGLAVAKAQGLANPTLGILNVDSARAVERNLKQLAANGYKLTFAESVRGGGPLMRGNDLLMGSPDVLVTDTLTGNVLMKVFSAFNSGGNYETLGSGYGPGVGAAGEKIILIISRASGAPVAAEALKFAEEVARGGLVKAVKAELAAAGKAGLDDLLKRGAEKTRVDTVSAPPEKIVTEEITGLDILELETAQQALWKEGIFARSGMGCTGPIILTAPEDFETARIVLKKEGLLD